MPSRTARSRCSCAWPAVALTDFLLILSASLGRLGPGSGHDAPFGFRLHSSALSAALDRTVHTGSARRASHNWDRDLIPRLVGRPGARHDHLLSWFSIGS